MYQRATTSIIFAFFVLLSATTANGAADQDAQTFIQDVAQKAFTTVSANNISDSDRNEKFRQVFVASFNIPEMGKFVLTRHWLKATAAQQQGFLKEFENMQVLTWGRRFKGYNGIRLETLSAVRESDTGWLVDSRIIQTRGEPIPVQWRVRQDGEGNIRITDIIAAGVSMTLTFRDEYSNSLQRSGGNVDALLLAMRAKNEELIRSP